MNITNSLIFLALSISNLYADINATKQSVEGASGGVTNIAEGVSAMKYSGRLTLFHGEIIE